MIRLHDTASIAANEADVRDQGPTLGHRGLLRNHQGRDQGQDLWITGGMVETSLRRGLGQDRPRLEKSLAMKLKIQEQILRDSTIMQELLSIPQGQMNWKIPRLEIIKALYKALRLQICGLLVEVGFLTLHPVWKVLSRT